MSAAHTPGPWEARAGKSSHVCVYQSGTNHNVSVGSTKADAILIAAAPRTHAAASKVLAFLEANYSDADMPDLLPELRAALAAGVTP